MVFDFFFKSNQRFNFNNKILTLELEDKGDQIFRLRLSPTLANIPFDQMN
jgi:hypothetical protein